MYANFMESYYASFINVMPGRRHPKPLTDQHSDRTPDMAKAVTEHVHMCVAEASSPAYADAVTGEAPGLSISRFFFL
jgi:Fe-S cluster assembly scaffold protein SufB